MSGPKGVTFSYKNIFHRCFLGNLITFLNINTVVGENELKRQSKKPFFFGYNQLTTKSEAIHE